jgi:HD-like signal output (HDOD) protein
MATTAVLDPQAIIRDAIQNVSALATLPEVTSRIIQTVEDPKSSAGQLHKIIAHDPSLSARILKVVNSAFYGVSGQVGSVDRAIVLLGMTAVKNIAVAASLGQLFRGVKLGAGVSPRDLWNHCIGVGVVARELARVVTGVNSEEIFLAGLIHDVGILVALQTWPEKLQTVCTTVKNTGAPFCDVERQILGVDHQMLGKGLAEMWKFTQSCQNIAGYHHEPSAAAEVHRPLVTLVKIADTICCQEPNGFTLTARSQEIDEETLSYVGLNQSHLDSVKEAMAGKIKDAMSVFAA